MPIYEGTATANWPGCEYIVARSTGACWNCSTQTDRVEINFQTWLCSTDCVASKDREFWTADWWATLVENYRRATEPDDGVDWG